MGAATGLDTSSSIPFFAPSKHLFAVNQKRCNRVALRPSSAPRRASPICSRSGAAHPQSSPTHGRYSCHADNGRRASSYPLRPRNTASSTSSRPCRHSCRPYAHISWLPPWDPPNLLLQTTAHPCRVASSRLVQQINPIPALPRMPALRNHAVLRYSHRLHKLRSHPLQRLSRRDILRIARHPQRVQPKPLRHRQQQSQRPLRITMPAMSLFDPIPHMPRIHHHMPAVTHPQPNPPKLLAALRMHHPEAPRRHMMNRIHLIACKLKPQLSIAQLPRHLFDERLSPDHTLCFSICSACRRDVSVKLAPDSIRAISSTRSLCSIRRTPVCVRPRRSVFSIKKC